MNNKFLRSGTAATPVVRDRSSSTVQEERIHLPAASLKFPKFKHQLDRKSNWQLYKHHLVSEIEAANCDFLVAAQIVNPPGMTLREVDDRKKKVRNFIVMNTSDELFPIVQRQTTNFDILEAMDKTFVPRGETT